MGIHIKRNPSENYEHLKNLQPQFVRFLMFSQPNKILFYYLLHSVSYQKPYWENDGSIFGPSILLTRPRKNGNFINWLPIFFRLRSHLLCGVASIFCFLLSFHSPVYITLMIHIRFFPNTPQKTHIFCHPLSRFIQYVLYTTTVHTRS